MQHVPKSETQESYKPGFRSCYLKPRILEENFKAEIAKELCISTRVWPTMRFWPTTFTPTAVKNPIDV